MQPKNARDSFDFNRPDGHANPMDNGIIISSKEKSKTSQRQQKSMVVGEATVSSIRARESAKLKQPKNEYSAAKLQVPYGRPVTTTQPELSIGSRDGDAAGVSRQQRITVNSSYKSKKANQLDN